MLSDGENHDADVLSVLFMTTIGAALTMGAAWYEAPWFVIWFFVAVMMAPITGLMIERLGDR